MRDPLPKRGTFAVTLGTKAGPTTGESQGIATALLVDGDLYLVDCGLGLCRQLRAAGLPMNRLRAVFVTHLHSDHTIELPALLLYNWGPDADGFAEPFDVVGPGSANSLPRGYPAVAGTCTTPGIDQVLARIYDAYAYDINIRVTDEDRPLLADLVRPHPIQLPGGLPAAASGDLAPPMAPFQVYADDKVRVLATLVHHPPVFPSYGFLFETPHGTVAISGDTTEHENVVELSRGADLLFHESVYLEHFRGRGINEAFMNHLAGSHTAPAGVGRIAAAAGAGHVVFQHLAGGATDEQWAAPARKEFSGRISVAHDLDVFPLPG